MTERMALKIVLGLSMAGTLFSGTLSYVELFGQTAASCPAIGAPGTLLGYPACVYGFGMFILLTIISSIGLFARRDRLDTLGT